MPDRSSTQVRIIDAYYVRDGRRPVRMFKWIGLFVSFDRDGLALPAHEEFHERQAAGLPARWWQAGPGHVRQIERHLKIAA